MENKKEKSIKIFGVFFKTFYTQKAKSGLNFQVHVEEFKKELDKYCNENGYANFCVLQNPNGEEDSRGNDHHVLLNTYKPPQDGSTNSR